MKSRIVGVLAAVAIALVGTVSFSVASYAVEDESGEGFETVLRETNNYREFQGEERLLYSVELSSVAQVWAEQMASDYASSHSFDVAFRHNPTLSSQIPSGWSRAGENIALNQGYPEPYLHLMEQWRLSPHHEENMVFPSWTHVGIGVFTDSYGISWGVQVFAQYGSASALADPGDLEIDLENESYSGTAACVSLLDAGGSSVVMAQCGSRPGNEYHFADLAPGSYTMRILDSGQGVLASRSVSVTTGNAPIANSVTATATPDSFGLPGQSPVLSVSTDPSVDTFAEVWWAWSPDVWSRSGTRITIANGVGSLGLNPQRSTWYKVVVDGVESDPVLVSQFEVDSVTLTGPSAFVVGGASPVVNVHVSPEFTGDVATWYRLPGGSWKLASPTHVTDGDGSRALSPSQTTEYRMSFGDVFSETLTLNPASNGSMSVSAPSEFVLGSTIAMSISTGDGYTGNVDLWYRFEGGVWRQAGTAWVSNGSGVRLLTPSRATSYRITRGSVYSNTAMTSPVPLSTVTLDAPTSFVPNQGGVTASIAVDPTVTAHMEIWYALSPGAWRKSTSTAQVTNGAGELHLNPSRPTWYRVGLDGVYSNIVKLDPLTVNSITASGPGTFVKGGPKPTVDVEVDPAFTGDLSTWYRLPGGAWQEASPTPIVDGSGSRLMSPSRTTEYRFSANGVYSNTIVLSPAPIESVSVSGDGTYIDGGLRPVMSVSVVPAVTDDVDVWYSYDGSTWKYATQLRVEDGEAFLQLNPSRPTFYRVSYSGKTSSTFAAQPRSIDALNLSVVNDGSPTLSVAVDPALDGVAAVWYRFPGGAWQLTSVRVDITQGSGEVSISPRRLTEYRVTINGFTSNTVSEG